MTRKALITGGAGFIGSHVAEEFIRGGWGVDVLDNLSSGRRENIPAAASAFHELDITDPESAEVIVRGGYDVICHLAAQIDVRKSVSDPLHDARVNILGTLNLMEGVRRARTRARVVFSSTGGAIYGGFVIPPSGEDAAKEPEAPYGIAKLSVEYYLAFYSRVLGCECVALRYSNVYGPRQDPHGEAGVVAIFCGRVLDGRPLTVFGDGSQTRDYVYVGDVARANFLAATTDIPAAGVVDARSFNIGTGVETSVIELAEIIRNAGSSDVALEYQPARAGELARSAVDPAKARTVLGWEPGVTLEEGLRETFAWFADRHAGKAGVPR